MMDRNGYYCDGGGTHWGPWIVMMVAMVVILGGLAWIFVTLLRHRADHTHTHNVPSPPTAPNPDALRILDARLARGEIDESEYTRLRDLIRGGA